MRLLRSRRGIELSVNFLVSFILAIVLFSLGIIFTRNLFSGSTEIAQVSQDQLDAAIEDMFCTNSELVCINLNAATLERGQDKIFGITVFNALDDGDFTITIRDTKRIEKDGTATDLSTVPPEQRLSILPSEVSFPLQRNRDERTGFLITARSTNLKGKYIVDADVVYKGNCDGSGVTQECPYPPKQKIYITVI